MSKLRPELGGDGSHLYAPQGTTAYYQIYGSVLSHTEGLIHGRLHSHGAHCAIGSYYTDHPAQTLYTTMIDEVAAVNDSVPSYTPKQRRTFVLRWLRWKLAQAGMSGFRTTRNVTEKK